ncbi:uncharacterized protein LOC141649894 [Silene latifolia]|uniref:uncharacterized protein LOC141649894 n=1 Tax=Silene latifolia TaxID=37657 RepID=UPI003D772F0B
MMEPDYYGQWWSDPDVRTFIERDDKERFLWALSAYVDTVDMKLVQRCAGYKAKKCLLAMIHGEGSVPALELYARFTALFPDRSVATPLATVAFYFPEAYDIMELLLSLGPVDHANIKCAVVYPYIGPEKCPIDLLLMDLSHQPHLLTWTPGTSLFKLIILLCQWESKSSLDCARLLAPHTDGLNDIAWSYLTEGRLASFAALLLVAPEKVLLPFDSGLTIQQRIMDILKMLRFEGDLDHEGAIYQHMLIEAGTLLDILEKTGGALRLYCSSMHEYVPPHDVLIDVAFLLKEAGYALEPKDIDLRDCYRKCPEVKKASVLNLLGTWQTDPECPSNKYRSPPSLTWAQDSGAIIHRFPYAGNCQLFQKLKSGRMLNLKTSASERQLLSTAAGQVEKYGSGIPRKYLAYIASKLKKGIKF